MNEKSLNISDQLIDLCYKLAEDALASGEVPVGCVFVHDINHQNPGTVMATGHNRTNISRNATRHAEIECIDIMIDKFGANTKELGEFMSKTTVLLTLEPCVMCARALRALRVKEVLFGAKNERFGGSGSVYDVHTNEAIGDPPLQCHQALDSQRSIKLLQLFYEQNNQSAPKPNLKKLKTR